RCVGVDRVLVAHGQGICLLRRIGKLRPDLGRTCSATADRARAAVDVLLLILLLGRVGVVRRVRIGLRDGELVRRARTGGDVSTGSVGRRVRVDGVLLADR